jgi:hypothetical protein
MIRSRSRAKALRALTVLAGTSAYGHGTPPAQPCSVAQALKLPGGGGK